HPRAKRTAAGAGGRHRRHHSARHPRLARPAPSRPPRRPMNSPSTMQALQMRGPGELVLTPLPAPAPGPREVLIRTLAATICTSDLHDLARNPFAITLPRVLGHEAAGVVVACGAEVREFTPGMRVAVHPVVPCGECAECARGFGHLCSRMG